MGRISSLIKKEIKIEGEEGSENNILNKNNIKVQKSNLLNDNESLASQNTINSKSKGLLAVGKRNKKKYNLNEYKDCNQIKGVVYITILIIIFILIFEYFHIYYLESTIIDFNDSYIKYRKFSKYYFQLFPLTLSLACIQQDINCRSLVSYYSEQYTQNNPDINYDIALFLRMQTERISNKIMDKRTILAKINKLIGEQNYEDNFGRIVNYTHITQTFTNEILLYNLSLVKTKFYNAIFIMINSFHKINSNNETDSSVYFLNKTEHPFTCLNKISNNKKELDNIQRELYELILNFKIYANQYDLINTFIKKLLYKTSDNIQIFIYIYLHLNFVMILLICILIYIYII